MLNFLYQTMSHLWFGLAVFFDYFLYLQPNRVFSNNLISTKLFVKKQATYYCVFFVARHPQYLLVFIWRKLAYQHQFHLYYRSWSSQRSFNRFLYKSAHLCSLCFVYPYQSCSRERLLFLSRRATGRTFITLVQTKKRTAASRYRRKFYFRFQPYHFTRLILLPPHIYTIN